MGSFPPAPPRDAHLWRLPWGWGQAPWVPGGQRADGLFDQWFRLMPGCWDRGQWPNRPGRMPPGPRQECHSSSWAWLPRARPGLRGEEREAAFPGPERAGGTPGAHEPKPTRHSWMDRQQPPGQLGSEGKGDTEGSRWGQGHLAGVPHPQAPHFPKKSPCLPPASAPLQATAPRSPASCGEPRRWSSLGGAGPEAPGRCDSRSQPGPGPGARRGMGWGRQAGPAERGRAGRAVAGAQRACAPGSTTWTPHARIVFDPSFIGAAAPPGRRTQPVRSPPALLSGPAATRSARPPAPPGPHGPLTPAEGPADSWGGPGQCARLRATPGARARESVSSRRRSLSRGQQPPPVPSVGHNNLRHYRHLNTI